MTNIKTIGTGAYSYRGYQIWSGRIGDWFISHDDKCIRVTRSLNAARAWVDAQLTPHAAAVFAAGAL